MLEIEDRTPTQHAITREIYKACQSLGAKSDLLAIIGSIGDTLPDEEILWLLEEWNEARSSVTEENTGD